MDKLKVGNSSSRDFSPDVLFQILAGFPPNARRRFRQVCRLWQDVIDQRTATDMRRRTKIIALVDNTGFTSVQSVIDLGTSSTTSTDLLWPTRNTVGMEAVRNNKTMGIVGIRNGLVCLCDDRKPGGAITVANPSTGEDLCLPPLPVPSLSADLKLSYNGERRSWQQTYGFGYSHTTGTYKVVHVPSKFDLFWKPDTMHVFTLGESSWRDVHTDTVATRCRLGVGSFADVDDKLYWLTEDAGKIMSFDLENERVACIEPLPVQAKPSTCRLMKMQGRLGVAISGGDSVTVWVLEDESWSRRYMLDSCWAGQKRMRWELAWPHSVRGDYFMTLARESSTKTRVLYGHKISNAARSEDGVVHIRHKDRGEELARFPGPVYQMFSYVETKEPFSVYNAVSVQN